MLSYNAMGTCVLVLTLGTILVIALVIHKEKSGKGVGTAILVALIGILLGAGGLAAGIQIMGYDIARANSYEMPDTMTTETGTDGEDMGGGMGGDMAGMGAGMGGMSGGMGGMSGGAGGMGGGMGMMGGGMGGARGGGAKRQLTTLVRKIDLLTGDVALDLSPEQSNELVGVLNRIKAQEAMSDEDAAALETELLALLTDDQDAKQAAVSLPRGRGGRGGGMGGGPPAGGAGESNAEANPFEQEANSEALGSLLQRFGEPADDANDSSADAAPDPPAGDPPAADPPAADPPAADPPAGEAAPESTKETDAKAAEPSE